MRYELQTLQGLLLERLFRSVRRGLPVLQQLIDYYSETAEGSFIGGTFTGGFDFTDDWDNHYSGTVEARVVGDPPNRLVFFELHQTETDPYLTRKTRIRIENVNVWPGYWGLEFYHSGYGDCDYLTTFSDTLIYSDYQDMLETWDCLHEEQSPSVEISFWEE